MSDLTDFLLARITEDEAVAHAVPNWQDHLTHETAGFSANASRFVMHVTPSRVLADCDAKRRIVERYLRMMKEAAIMFGAEASLWRGLAGESWLALADLATAYRDHPDYREEWRP